MEKPKTVSVVALESFALGEKNFLPGRVDVPADKVDGLVKKKLIAPPDGSAPPENDVQGEESQRLEVVVARLSGALPFARKSDETPLDTLERMAEEIEGSGTSGGKSGEVPATEEFVRAVGNALTNAKALNALQNAGYKTLDDLRAADDADLLALPDFGEASLEKLRAALK